MENENFKGGLLLLNKPCGVSSNKILQKIRILYGRIKAGHTGTLDPLASGLLPITMGEATKFSQFYLNANKTYVAKIRLGFNSSTGDSEGKIKFCKDFRDPSEDLIKRCIKTFVGEYRQVPPMFSALKAGGIPLYKLARKGQKVERKPRVVSIYKIKLLNISLDQVEIFVSCSKGTYIRTLAEDIGKKLGCGAYLNSLKRESVGKFSIFNSYKIDYIEKISYLNRKKLLMPIDAMLPDLPQITLCNSNIKDLYFGKKISVDMLKNSKVQNIKIFNLSGSFVGTGKKDEFNNLKSERLLSLNQSNNKFI